jgi:hypothetical protein
MAAIPASCRAQDDPAFHSCTVYAGGGYSQILGPERQNFNAGWKNFQAGGGFAVTSHPAARRSWSAFLTANFLFDQVTVKPAAIEQAKVLNPTNVGILAANSGRAKFYSTTLDLTFRVPVKGPVELYGFAGFGWLRRDLEFTGASGAGVLLEPGSPVVFGSGGNSGAFDVGGGAEFRLPRKAGGLMLYIEGRVLHGLAVNHETTLLPFSAGVRW